MATLAHEVVTEVFTQFGEKSLPADRVAAALVQEVKDYQQAHGALGPHLADQWALPLALAVWRRQRGAAYSCTELTDHATTNFEMVERFLPVRFEVTGAAGDWRVALRPAAA
jgi:RNA 3'-terminal phosphate cyclase (ATP)